MHRPTALALALLAAALSGCLQAPGEAPAAKPAALDETIAVPGVPGAVAANGSLADWYALDAVATPEAALVGAWWSVPAGAVVEHALYKEWFDEERSTVVLEVALVVPNGSADLVKEWAVYAFARDDGKLEPLASAVAVPFQYAVRELAVEEGEEPIFTSPFFLQLGLDDLVDGEPVCLVLAARSESPLPVRLAFRALPEYPARNDDPADDADAFLAQRGGLAPRALVPVGSGSGFQSAVYLDFESGLFPSGLEAWTSAVQIDQSFLLDARPFASSRQARISASFDTPEGYADAFSLYWGSEAVGRWSASVDLRGEQDSGQRPIVHTPGPFGVLMGVPFAWAIGDGEGPSASELVLDVHNANVDSFEALVFEQTDLGASLATLLGEGGMTDAGVSGSIDLPAVALARDGRHLHLLSQDGTTHKLLGVLPEA